MEDTRFSLEEIDKTFTDFNSNKIYSAIVISKCDEGVIVNIGGKSDAIILNEEFDDLNAVKIGDTFSVVSMKQKTENNIFIVSKNKAEVLTSENLIIKDLKLGSVFSFVPIQIKNNGLYSKLGDFEVFVSNDEVDIKKNIYLKNYLNKQLKAVVVEINNKEKKIIASSKILKEQEYMNTEMNFWKSIFINKVVEGEIEKILPYGAFVNVDGITCFVHISDMSYSKINSPEEILSVGQKRKFKVVKIDKENKKVNLGIKQLEENPKTNEIKKLNLGDILDGVVTKLLPYGVIVQVNENLSGLLHISDATDNKTLPVHQLFRVNDCIKVCVIKIDIELQRVNFSLFKEN